MKNTIDSNISFGVLLIVSMISIFVFKASPSPMLALVQLRVLFFTEFGQQAP
tara:strand:+ start:859 stop:1014 length:156 start_codon:yes stop_codon:yes gene_type:complete